MSIDGYIATSNDELTWLEEHGKEETLRKSPYSYKAYYNTVSSIIMGRRTYETIKSLGSYPYPEKHGYVISNNTKLQTGEEDLTILQDSDLPTLTLEKEHYNGRMWLVGGGKIAGVLMNLKLIDELIITVIPCILGEGIPWIANCFKSSEWLLHDSVQLGSVMQFQYIRLCK